MSINLKIDESRTNCHLRWRYSCRALDSENINFFNPRTLNTLERHSFKSYSIDVFIYTIVAYHHCAPYHSGSNFTLPDGFIPERWLHIDPCFAPHDKDALEPLSLGTKAYLGMKCVSNTVIILWYTEDRLLHPRISRRPLLIKPRGHLAPNISIDLAQILRKIKQPCKSSSSTPLAPTVLPSPSIPLPKASAPAPNPAMPAVIPGPKR